MLILIWLLSIIIQSQVNSLTLSQRITVEHGTSVTWTVTATTETVVTVIATAAMQIVLIVLTASILTVQTAILDLGFKITVIVLALIIADSRSVGQLTATVIAPVHAAMVAN